MSKNIRGKATKIIALEYVGKQWKHRVKKLTDAIKGVRPKDPNAYSTKKAVMLTDIKVKGKILD